MNKEKLISKVLKEPAMKVGNGDKAYKTLTSAVKAAEAAKDEACRQHENAMWYAEKCRGYALECNLIREDVSAQIMREHRFIFRATLFLAIMFLLDAAVIFFCS